MDYAEYPEAHARCTRNRHNLANSARCGCFYCLRIFTPREIYDWCDEGETALCPFCETDAVVCETPDWPLNGGVLEEMRRRAFEARTE
ncbi:MAG: cytoplasmic protein [Defluviitaleaceae bacterium]|nr:cytoplasmic protein [Defluviitaleaceae bacterium]